MAAHSVTMYGMHGDENNAWQSYRGNPTTDKTQVRRSVCRSLHFHRIDETG